MTVATYDNILETIGNTPIVRISRLAPENVNIFAKIESFNPMGSVKDRLEIPYRSVDLDSVEYQNDDLGGKFRAALHARTGAKTIPQIFIGGEHIGGATELFDAAKDGTMQRLLDKSSVIYNSRVRDDPYSFLPSWLHAR